jgi:cytochrome c5
MLKKLIGLSMIAFLMASFINMSQAEEELDAKKIFEDNKCNLCHSIEVEGIEAKKKSDKYPDLSKMSADHDAELLAKYLHKDEKINDKKHPMPFKGSDEEMTALITWMKELHAANAGE